MKRLPFGIGEILLLIIQMVCNIQIVDVRLMRKISNTQISAIFVTVFVFESINFWSFIVYVLIFKKH
jgi:hypothetical protein